jgi:hypothetical protein
MDSAPWATKEDDIPTPGEANATSTSGTTKEAGKAAPASVRGTRAREVEAPPFVARIAPFTILPGMYAR